MTDEELKEKLMRLIGKPTAIIIPISSTAKMSVMSSLEYLGNSTWKVVNSKFSFCIFSTQDISSISLLGDITLKMEKIS